MSVRIYSVIALVLLFCSNSYSQLVPVRHNYLWGYQDISSSRSIPCVYTAVNEFDTYGHAIVETPNGEKVIDETGNTVTPEYPNIELLNKSLYVVKGDSCSTIKSYKELNYSLPDVVDIRDYQARKKDSLRAYFYQLSNHSHIGLIDTAGEIIIPLNYKLITASQGVFYAKINAEKTHIYSFDGILIDSCAYDYLEYDNEVIYAYIGDYKGLINSDGKELVEPKWKYIKPTSFPNLFIVGHNHKQKFIYNSTVKDVIRKKFFQSFSVYPNGLIRISTGRSNGLINAYGKTVLKDTFNLIKYWDRNTIIVSSRGKYGICDSTGKYLLKPVFKNIIPVPSKKIALFINQKSEKGIYNSRGRKIISCKFDNIEFHQYTLRTKIDDVTTHYTIDDNGNLVSKKEIKNLHVLKINKFRFSDDFKSLNENLVSNNVRPLEENASYRYINDSLGLALELQANATGMFRLYDLNNDRALSKYALDWFNLSDFANGRYTIAPYTITSTGGSVSLNRVFSRRGKIVSQGSCNGQVYAITTATVYRNGYAPFYNKKNDAYGLVNRDGKITVPPLYDRNIEIKKDVAIVRKDNQIGAVSAITGKIIIPFTTGNIYFNNYADPTCLIISNPISVKGFVDTLGHEKGFMIFEQARNFNEERAAVRFRRKWTYINTEGDTISPPMYQNVQDFSEGVAAVRFKNKWGFIDQDNNYAIEPQFKDTKSFKDGLAPAKLERRYGYLDQKGNWIIEPKFIKAYEFDNGLASVRKRKKYGLIDLEGNFISGKRFKKIERFPEMQGYSCYKGKSRYLLFNANGTPISKTYYKKVQSLGQHLYWVKSKEFTGIIDSRGKPILDTSIAKAQSFYDTIAWAKLGKKWGLIDTSGEWLIPPEYSHVKQFDNRGIAYANGPGYYYKLYRQGGEVVKDKTIKEKFNANYGRFYLGEYNNQKLYQSAPNYLVGIRNETGNLLLYENYNRISSYHNGFAIVDKTQLYGLYKLDGSQICPTKYEKVEMVLKGVYRVRGGGHVGYIGEDGNWLIPLAK